MQIIFNKEAKVMRWRKESLFNKSCWENERDTCKGMKLDCYLSPYTKIKVDQRPKYKTCNHKLHGEKHRN